MTAYDTNTIGISWVEPVDNAIKEYQVTYVDSDDASQTQTVTAPATATTLSSLVPGENYDITIKSIGKDGTESSAVSNEVSQTTSKCR